MVKQFLLFVSIIFVGGGCADKATAPLGEPIDYVAYAFDEQFRQVYEIHLGTHAVDSMLVPTEVYPFFVPDARGTRLYFDAPAGVIGFDLGTSDTSLFWPARSMLEFSPDGKLAVMAWNRESYTIFRLPGMRPIYTDSENVLDARFSQDSKRLYLVAAGTPDLPRDIVCVHLDSDFASERRRFNVAEMTRLLISADEKRWFWMNQGYGERLQVYDVAADAIIFDYYQSPGSGDLQQTSDGRYVFLTNPGSWVQHPETPLGTPNVYVYGVAANAFIKTINTTGIFGSDSVSYEPRIRGLAVTPDDRYLLGVDDNCSGRYVIISIATLEVVYRGGISPSAVERCLFDPVIPGDLRW